MSAKCNENSSLGPEEVWGVREGFLEDFLLSFRKKLYMKTSLTREKEKHSSKKSNM